MGWNPFPFQEEAWYAYLEGYSGLINAPTGSGKTYSLLIACLLEFIKEHPDYKAHHPKGIQVIWITPIRALSKEIFLAAQRALTGMEIPWQVGVRSGDTSLQERQKQKAAPPQLLITTPESLHLLLAQKSYPELFKSLRAVIVDEWHELMGSKRGVQIELALSRLKGILPNVKIWGISATIGNMDDALRALLGDYFEQRPYKIVKANIEKKVEVISVIPDNIERMPWAGHVGIHLLEKVIQIVNQSTSTLIFTNTRSFAEIWYQKMLDKCPELAGSVAMHHGSISQEIRSWVEDELHAGRLKAVVCTSSLDLGVDFRPVETVVQIGGAKGVARILQRAGRSGHQPGGVSRIYFVPTHSLELIEAAAIREALRQKVIENRYPYLRSFDVLIQYLVTLAVSDGFEPDQIFAEVTGTFCFSSMSVEEWRWVLNFITSGGDSLQAYNEYRKVVIRNGIYKVENRGVAMRHRLSIGTIVGDNALFIRFLSGKYLGSIEEYFIARLKPGDVFWFAGKNLELIRVKDMEVFVRKSTKKSGMVPSWMGGRMPLSSEMGEMIRLKLHEVHEGKAKDPELLFLEPMFDLQREQSKLPSMHEFLIEYFQTSDGYHLMMYPFEGRFVHEGLAAIVAYRIAQIQSLSFSIAMNDYGFELLSNQPIPVEEAVETNVLGTEFLSRDIHASVNSIEMARRKFRDISAISGLIFKGFPGKPVKEKHLQSSSHLFFNVFHDYDPHNLLLRQAYEEVMDFQLEEARLRRALDRIAKQKIVITYPDRPTPLSFPIMVDRLNREKLSSESIEARIRQMVLQYEDKPSSKNRSKKKEKRTG